MREIHFLSKPNLSITPLIKPHSTLSNALLMSSLMDMKLSFPLVSWFRQCISSNATRTLSVISLSKVKEGALVFGYNICKDCSQAVSEDLGDELIGNIAEVDWLKLRHSGGMVSFGDEGYVCFFLFYSHEEVGVKYIENYVSNI